MKDVSPLITHWSYAFLALAHRNDDYIFFSRQRNSEGRLLASSIPCQKPEPNERPPLTRPHSVSPTAGLPVPTNLTGPAQLGLNFQCSIRPRKRLPCQVVVVTLAEYLPHNNSVSGVKPRVIMLPNLASLVASHVVVKTNYGATNNDNVDIIPITTTHGAFCDSKVGIIATHGFQCRRWWIKDQAKYESNEIMLSNNLCFDENICIDLRPILEVRGTRSITVTPPNGEWPFFFPPPPEKESSMPPCIVEDPQDSSSDSPAPSQRTTEDELAQSIQRRKHYSDVTWASWRHNSPAADTFFSSLFMLTPKLYVDAVTFSMP